MTVQELINHLTTLPDSFKNCKVAIYNEITEDSGLVEKVRIFNKSEGPYNKGDDVWSTCGIPAEEDVVFLGNFYYPDDIGDIICGNQ